MRMMGLFDRGPTKGKPILPSDTLEIGGRYVCNDSTNYVRRNEEVTVVFISRSKVTFSNSQGQYSCTPSDFRKYFNKL